jgi:hypothetical protein
VDILRVSILAGASCGHAGEELRFAGTDGMRE